MLLNKPTIISTYTHVVLDEIHECSASLCHKFDVIRGYCFSLKQQGETNLLTGGLCYLEMGRCLLTFLGEINIII